MLLIMSITETVVSHAAQSYPLTELDHEGIPKDPESSSEQQQLSGSESIDCEPATPFLKLLVAGYSFFCAGVSDGTCE